MRHLSRRKSKHQTQDMTSGLGCLQQNQGRPVLQAQYLGVFAQLTGKAHLTQSGWGVRGFPADQLISITYCMLHVLSHLSSSAPATILLMVCCNFKDNLASSTFSSLLFPQDILPKPILLPQAEEPAPWLIRDQSRNGAMDRKITQVPSMETFLRARDLPSFLRESEPSDPFVARMISETKQAPRAYGFILNTFEDLEAPLLSHFRSHCPNIYTLGPIHALLESKLPRDRTSFTDSNSLWQEDKSCMSWLDMMPVKSVLYVSFGSIATFTRDQILEIWHGLVNSKKSFLWVIRPESIIGEEGSAVNLVCTFGA
ncbi:hypothetical protein RJ641_005629 [Dillenia turbinata]|uniref:Uncharacterized protein n=1 Tax=Dillenia turbinata TaxID=194707 RepID=A0AAN8V9Q4_9MAGN